MPIACHPSYPLNSENASPPRTFTVYLSCAAMTRPPRRRAIPSQSQSSTCSCDSSQYLLISSVASSRLCHDQWPIESNHGRERRWTHCTISGVMNRIDWTKVPIDTFVGVGMIEARPSSNGQAARRSEDRVQDHPAVRNERHGEAQHGAQDNGCDLAVLGVHPDEHDALDREERGGQHGERRPPVKGGGDDQADRADEFEDAEGPPGFPRQRIKGPDLLADVVEHEDLHDARRSVDERGEYLQDPQQNVHRVPPPERTAPQPFVRVFLHGVHLPQNNLAQVALMLTSPATA